MSLILAALLATIPVVDATGRAQLLPAGEFAARDGRPGPGLKWHLDDAQGARLAADINAIAAVTSIVIDYEHQTFHAEKNGEAAPAAGWITRVEWVPGKGLFADVQWTAKAKAHITADEYRYISPVIAYDQKTGRVTGLLNAALVNQPALVGMDRVSAALAARFPTPTPEPEPPQMDRAKLIVLLGLSQTATDTEIEAALAKLKSDHDTAATEVAKLKDAAKSSDVQTLQVVTDLQRQVAALTTAHAEDELTKLVDGAITASKFLPAHRTWLLDVGRKDLAALKKMLDASPVIAGLKGQSGGKEPAGGGSGLTEEQMAMCKNMGLTVEQFKAAL